MSPSSRPFEARIQSRATTPRIDLVFFIPFRRLFDLRPAVQVPPITHHDGIDQPVMFHDGDILGEQLLLERQGH